jgi:Uma2 family endonuclease
MVAAAKLPQRMTIEEFLAWSSETAGRWQLVDGQPRSMAPPGHTHAMLQSELIRVIGNHLVESRSPCRVAATPGIVPHVRARDNVRIPDAAVTCSSDRSQEAVMAEPLLIVEVLSPSNEGETWANVWAYTTIPTVQEIVVLHTDEIAAEIVRRRTDGSWPKAPHVVRSGDISLDSIGFRTPLAALYRTTKFERSA